AYAVVAFFLQAEDGIRDFHVTGVQTCALPISVQGLNLAHLHRHFELEGQARNRLTEIAVAVHDLFDREPVPLQFETVSCRGLPQLAKCRSAFRWACTTMVWHPLVRLLEYQGLDGLVEEQRYAVLERDVLPHRRDLSPRCFLSAALDQLRAVSGQEMLEHGVPRGRNSRQADGQPRRADGARSCFELFFGRIGGCYFAN